MNRRAVKNSRKVGYCQDSTDSLTFVSRLCYNMGIMAIEKAKERFGAERVKSEGEASQEIESKVETRESGGAFEAEAAAQKEAVEITEQAKAVQAAAAALPSVEKDRLTQEIEAVLAEDLTELFLQLPKEQQAAFQQKGEVTAGTIRRLLQEAKVNVKKIFALIAEWLQILPGVNRFFLEQEAKIKTDRILLLSREDNILL